MGENKSDKRLCEVSLNDYRALGNGEVAAKIMNGLAEVGVPMYGVQFGTDEVSFITDEEHCEIVLKIAEKESEVEGSPKSLSIRKDIGLVVVSKSKLPKGMDSFLYLAGALSDCGVRIIGADIRENETLIIVAYDDVERAERIIKQISGA